MVYTFKKKDHDLPLDGLTTVPYCLVHKEEGENK
jgi:hypothetical protein